MLLRKWLPRMYEAREEAGQKRGTYQRVKTYKADFLLLSRCPAAAGTRSPAASRMGQRRQAAGRVDKLL